MLFALNTAAVKIFSVNWSTAGLPYQPIAGLGPLVTLSKNGGPFVVPSITGHATDLGSGVYSLPVGSADVNTVGSLTWRFSFNDGLHQFSETDQVVTALPGDPGELTNAERDAIAAATLGLANGVDVGVSLAHFCMAAAAVLAGKTGVAMPVTQFRNWADTKDRVTVTAGPGGRSSVVFDFT
jgi:hypothetical protein